jgi:hypothetical protein
MNFFVVNALAGPLHREFVLDHYGHVAIAFKNEIGARRAARSLLRCP